MNKTLLNICIFWICILNTFGNHKEKSILLGLIIACTTSLKIFQIHVVHSCHTFWSHHRKKILIFKLYPLYCQRSTLIFMPFILWYKVFVSITFFMSIASRVLCTYHLYCLSLLSLHVVNNCVYLPYSARYIDPQERCRQ